MRSAMHTPDSLCSGTATLLEILKAYGDVALEPSVHGLGDQVMLGVAGTPVVGMDRLWAALWPLNVRKDQPPAFLFLLEMVGKTAPADDLSKGLSNRFQFRPPFRVQ